MPDGTAVVSPSGERVNTAVDAGLLSRIESEAGVPVVRLSTDESDLRRLLRIIESSLQVSADPDAQWLDRAWWVVWPSALLMLLWFRKGWTMQW